MRSGGGLAVQLQVEGEPVLVVGGGSVAARKCRSCLAAGAVVTVVAPELSPAAVEMHLQGEITWVSRRFQPGDTRGYLLVFAATDDRHLNQAIAAEARVNRVLVDVVDDPASGNFISPAVLKRGGLTIAVSTEGAAPVLARQIRDAIAAEYGDEYALVVQLLAAVRQKLLTESHNRPYNNRIFEALAASELPKYCREGDVAAINRLLGEAVGNGCTLAQLGLTAKGLS